MYLIPIVLIVAYLLIKSKNNTSSTGTSYSTNHPYENNNPLNIKGSGWNGQIGSDSQGHAIFDNVNNGVRAAIKNLHTYYYAHNLKTILRICQRWAVANQKVYANFVASGSQLGSTQIFDFNLKNISNIVFNMANFETKKQYLPANLMEIIKTEFNKLYPNQIPSSTVVIPFSPKVIGSDVIKSLPQPVKQAITDTPLITNVKSPINQVGAASSQASCNNNYLGNTFIKPLL